MVQAQVADDRGMNNYTKHREDRALARFARAIGYVPTLEQLATAYDQDRRRRAREDRLERDHDEDGERWDAQE